MGTPPRAAPATAAAAQLSPRMGRRRAKTSGCKRQASRAWPPTPAAGCASQPRGTKGNQVNDPPHESVTGTPVGLPRQVEGPERREQVRVRPGSGAGARHRRPPPAQPAPDGGWRQERGQIGQGRSRRTERQRAANVLRQRSFAIRVTRPHIPRQSSSLGFFLFWFRGSPPLRIHLHAAAWRARRRPSRQVGADHATGRVNRAARQHAHERQLHSLEVGRRHAPRRERRLPPRPRSAGAGGCP